MLLMVENSIRAGICHATCSVQKLTINTRKKIIIKIDNPGIFSIVM